MLKMNHNLFAVDVNNNIIELTKTEYRLLSYLVKNSNRIVPKDELLVAVWPTQSVSKNNIEVLINMLRKKIGSNHIMTRRGIGYRVVTE